MKIPRLSSWNPNEDLGWFPDDTEEQFKKNMKDNVKRQRLIDLGYHKNFFRYQTDDLGFRNPPGVDISNSILTLGCSYTFGVGTPREIGWNYLLAEKLGVSYYNAGLPGLAPDGCFRIGYSLIPKYKPKAVYCLSPNRNRVEVISEFLLQGTPYTTSHWDYDKKEYDGFLRHTMDKRFQIIQEEKNILALEQLCIDNNIPFYIVSIRYLTKTMDHIMDTDGRDLMHSGIKTHTAIANQFYEFTKKFDSISKY